MPQLIAEQVVLIHESLPLRWIGTDGHVYEMDAANLEVSDLGGEQRVKGPVWDERFWYRTRCFEHCDGGTSMGAPRAVERIDRTTGERLRLGEGDYGLNNVVLSGDYVYWGVFGHQVDGGVWRVSKEGGDQHRVRLATSGWEDKVVKLVPYPTGLLSVGWGSIGWIPVDDDAGRYIATGFHPNDAVLDDNAVYVADEGKGGWSSEASGYIRRFSFSDGVESKLAGPFKWPAAVATFGPNVYFTLRQSNVIWSVSKAGGFPRVALRPASRVPCRESKELWATARGLIWSEGGGSMSFDNRRSLYFAPWAALFRSE